MKEYYVDVKEVWTQGYKVRANSKQEALDKVNHVISGYPTIADAEECEFLENSLKYSHTLESDFWTVSESE